MLRTIAKNTFYLLLSSTGQKILAFFYFTLIARLAGVEGTGKYFLALSFTTMFTIAVDLGLSPLLTREIAKMKEKDPSAVLRSTLRIKLFSAFVTFCAILIFAVILGYARDVVLLITLAALVMVFDSFHLSFYAVFRSLQKFQYEATGIFVGQVITLILGTASLLLHAPLYFLILSLFCGTLFNFFFSGTLLWKQGIFRRNKQAALSGMALWPLLRLAFPFAFAALFSRILSSIDSVMLSRILGTEAVGFWSVPYKLTFALQFIPQALGAALFPAMTTEYYAQEGEQISNVSRAFERSFHYLLLLAMPISVGTSILAPEIIAVAYGKSYLPSIAPLQILIFILPTFFLNFPIGSLLAAAGRQKTNAAIIGSAMGFNILVNLVLIPRVGVLGSAIAALSSSLLLFVLGMIISAKLISLPSRHLWKSFVQIALSSLGMALVLYAGKLSLQRPLFILFLVFPGAITYFLFLFLFKGLTVQDFKKIISIWLPRFLSR